MNNILPFINRNSLENFKKKHSFAVVVVENATFAIMDFASENDLKSFVKDFLQSAPYTQKFEGVYVPSPKEENKIGLGLGDYSL